MIEEFRNNNGLEDGSAQAKPNIDSVQLNPETEIERIPTPEEIISVFRELIGKEFTAICKEDEKGIYKYDVIIPGDLPGETIGYEYTRKGKYKEGSSVLSTIQIVYYEKDKDGQDTAVHGDPRADWVDGEWKII